MILREIKRMVAAKRRRGVTLVELVVTMTTISVIALAVGTVIIYLWQEFLYIPRQLTVTQAGAAMLEEMIEGSASSQGLRFANRITAATPSRVVYTYGYPVSSDSHTVTLRWDSATGGIYRSVDTGSEARVPYYAASVKVLSKTVPAGIFLLYKDNGVPWTAGTDLPASIRRIKVNLTVVTGSGAFSAYEGSITLTSGVEIHQ